MAVSDMHKVTRGKQLLPSKGDQAQWLKEMREEAEAGNHNARCLLIFLARTGKVTEQFEKA